MKRAEILDKAKECVCGQREQDYGSPEDNFKQIAELWSAYKNVHFSPGDVAMMMALLKIARIQSGTGTEDSFVDLAGYAACGGEIVTSSQNTEKNMADIRHVNAAINIPRVVFRTAYEAESVLDAMKSIIFKYTFVTVQDFFDITGDYRHSPKFEHYGWTYLNDVDVARVKDGYYLELPKAILIDNKEEN